MEVKNIYSIYFLLMSVHSTYATNHTSETQNIYLDVSLLILSKYVSMIQTHALFFFCDITKQRKTLYK